MAAEGKLREYLRKAAAELASARRALAAARARDAEPIAVIGMSCRFPAAASVHEYWDLLRDGRCAPIGDVPPGRFDHDPPAAGNELYTPRRGAFLPDVAGWDAAFFGFSPHEALRMDPQQRLLMELTWEAMEDAGTPPQRLAASRTGVLLGFSDTFQYGQVEAELEGRTAYTDPYMGQGSAGSVAAGRLAYHFDLRGPAFTLDTACSSSLLAVHLAVQALRRGECDYALAGGAFLALHPFIYIYSCATSLLSPTDRCHTFDTDADGYMMGEGGGLVMLARLSDAVQARHRVRAVIMGSAVNQDGRSNGLTAPSRAAQVDVIQRALASARVTADDVAYLEAHGTGTPLGDDIELGALNDVFGRRGPGRLLPVGAVKTNIGHTHAAAGIAGLIKTVLVLEHGTIPPNVNLAGPAEAVTASEAVRPASSLMRLPPVGHPPVVGVSSFGLSGTNVHVVLAGQPDGASPAVTEPALALAAAQRSTSAPLGTGVTARLDERPDQPAAQLLPVSAASDTALSEHLSRLGAAATREPLADVAFTLQSGRAEHGYRRAVIATGAADAATRLAAASARPGVTRLAARPRLAFLLPGVGDQYRGLGHALYRSEPAFAAAADECLTVAAGRCGIDLRPVLFADPPAGQSVLAFPPRPGAGAGPVDELLQHAEIAHPFLFTVEYALARLLAGWGVSPDLLIGYSLGEYTAACLASVFTLPDALWLVTERARLIEAAPPGRMLAVAAGHEQVRETLAGLAGSVGVAALNGPHMTVLSGSPGDVEAAADVLSRAGLAASSLRSAHAFHSTLLRPAQDKLAALIASVPRQAPQLPIMSNVTGELLTDAQATHPEYWGKHLCLPVRFADSIQQGLNQKIDAYIELGPGQMLGSLVWQNHAGGLAPAVFGTLPSPWSAQDQRSEIAGLLETCGRLWELGVQLNWPALRHGAGRLASLPAYPFQRSRFWPEAPSPARAGPRPGGTGQRPEPAGSADSRCYTAVWRPDLTRLPADAPGLAGPVVIFADHCGVGHRLADLAEAAGARVTEVVPGDELRFCGRQVTIDPARPDHYRQVFAAIAAEPDGPVRDGPAPGGPVHVVHLWSLMEAPEGPAALASDAELSTAVRWAFDSMLRTLQALGTLPAERGVRLLTVTAGAAEITGGDAVAPARTLVHGLALGTRAEYQGLAWRGVDLPPAAAPESADCLAEELCRGPWHYPDPAAEPALTGWRGGRRWLKGWAELVIGEAARSWDPGGCYLIVGGTRGLGLALARYLVRHGVRRLALAGRTDLRAAAAAPSQELAEPAARSLRDVAGLEEAGAQVLLLTADAGVPGQLRAALRQVREHFGALDGVIHTAGLPGSGFAELLSPADAGQVLAPKVLALGPLAELVGPAVPAAQRPRLLVLYSSAATVVGGLGEGDYCAANSVLDAFGTALTAAAGGTQVITVAWGYWQHDDWPGRLTGRPRASRAAHRERYGFTDDAGCALLSRLIANADGRLSGTVLALRQPLPQAIREWAAIDNLNDLLNETSAPPGQSRFPRPTLRTSYIPPRTELEATVAGVWSEFLGLDQVGVDDPFFDLGGNSLVGMAIVKAIERLLQRQIAPAVLIQHPTVAAFAAALDGADPAAPAAGSARGERRRRANRAHQRGNRG
jgi:acyl transferase domain-containing protein/NADP-dependent 3-hydroxy acid dehydrogenase YdfG